MEKKKHGTIYFGTHKHEGSILGVGYIVEGYLGGIKNKYFILSVSLVKLINHICICEVKMRLY